MYTIVYYEITNSEDNYGYINTMVVESEHGLNEALKKLGYDNLDNQDCIKVFKGKLQGVRIETKFVAKETT
jgi:hypothetical protein